MLKILVCLMALFLLVYSAFIGFVINGIDEHAPPSIFRQYANWLIPGAIGAFLMHWQMPKKSVRYWLLMFPISGMLSGLISWLIGMLFYLDEVIMLIVIFFVFFGMFFFLKFMEGVGQNSKLSGNSEVETPPT